MAIEMKTLTIGSTTYDVIDSDAVHSCAQTLTEAQKAQARANIDAVCADDAALLQGGINITSGANLNDYTTAGNYVCINSTIFSSLKNAPDYDAGQCTLYVRLATGTSQYVRQEISFFAGTARYARTCAGATWSNWVRVDGIDGIVSRGKSGDWYYRKWDNGFAECWYEGPELTVDLSAPKGTLYGGIARNIYLPITFVDIPRVTASWHCSDYVVFCGATLYNTTNIGVYLYRYSAVSSTTGYIGAYVCGHWK